MQHMNDHRADQTPSAHPDASLHPEPRIQRRKQALLPAVCCYDAGKTSFDCTIRDLTETGARIAFRKNSHLAASVQLINIKDHLAHNAKVVWTREAEAGLIFETTQPLSEITDPEQAYLRRLWFARAIR